MAANLLGTFVALLPYVVRARQDTEDQTTNGTIPINNTLQRDPYLDYQPIFADSLPIQILLTGIVLALCFVLFVHLLFTFQYHWPLARINYALQVSGVCTLLISLITSLVVVLRQTYIRSRQWPYMLDYVAITIPLGDEWNQAEFVLWYLLKALVSVIVNITHIQFLTLLYPSSVEARLIFFLLGPLAIASSGMEFSALLETQEAQDLGRSIRDICNSTLTLLFSASLFIWGLVLNRKNAWRTDGGTAVFGAGALGLAFISTIVNFVQITQEDLQWLPNLSWALILWQSFLGWWWWIGSGLGIGDVEDMLVEEQRKRDARVRRLSKKSRRKDHKTSKRAAVTTEEEGESGVDNTNSSAFTRLTSGFRRNTTTASRRRQMDGEENGGDRYRNNLSAGNVTSMEESRSGTFAAGRSTTLEDSVSHASYTSSGQLTGFMAPIFRTRPFTYLHSYWRHLRRAHRAATQTQAIEQIKIREEVGVDGGGSVWGLGNIGLREREDAEDRLRELNNQHRRDMLLDRRGGDDSSDRGVEIEMDVSTWADRVRDPNAPQPGRDYHSLDMDRTLSDPTSSGDNPTSNREADRPEPVPIWASRSSSFWWWGPLRRWRLQDSTTY